MSDSINSHVFISYNSEDRDEVERIVRALEGSGMQVWFDTMKIASGDDYVVRMEQAIQSALAAVVFFGKHNLGRWQEEERTAIQASPRKIPLISALLPGGPGPHELPAFHWSKRAVDMRAGVTPELVDAIREGIAKSRKSVLPERVVEWKQPLDPTTVFIASVLGVAIAVGGIAASWLRAQQPRVRITELQPIEEPKNIPSDLVAEER